MKTQKRKEISKPKRSEKRMKLSAFIDDEAVEVFDESDEGDVESKFKSLIKNLSIYF